MVFAMKAKRTIGTGSESVYVYYFASERRGDSWPCKIGRAKGDPIKRIRTQQASMQERPVVALVMRTSDSDTLESLIHSSLNRAPSFGREWFITSPAEVEQIFQGKLTSLVSIGLRIKSLRRSRGFTQKELADKACLLPKSISSIENDGEYLFSTLTKVLDALDVELVMKSKTGTSPQSRRAGESRSFCRTLPGVAVAVSDRSSAPRSRPSSKGMLKRGNLGDSSTREISWIEYRDVSMMP
jgi:transcriptional regulator with XRE-family HTH domain